MNRFVNVWEIESNFKCPVIGAMLSCEKHRSILRKCGWDVSRMKPYEYHSSLMGCLGDENAVSVKVNNFVRHQSLKLMLKVADLYGKGEGEKVRQLWNTCAKQGNIGPAMYAIVSYEDADIELLRDIHGEVHMLSHANMTEVFDIRKKWMAANDALIREKERVDAKNGRIRELVGQHKAVAESVRKLEIENLRLQNQVAALSGRLGPDDGREKERLAGLEAQLSAERARSIALERAGKQLQIDLFGVRNENTLIRRELAELVAALTPNLDRSAASEIPPGKCPAQGECRDDTCPNYTLCARRIFMIGGITKMKSYYRDIVEKAGGRFDYHDGYMKNASTGLAAKVKRCDVVVCPVSCNSHNACLRVKKLCQRYNKELKILSSASLSAVTQALFVPCAETGDETRVS